jgi:Zn-finger nucleic acid-binding protein
VTDPEREVRYEKCGVCQGVFVDAGEWKRLTAETLVRRLRRALGG